MSRRYCSIPIPKVEVYELYGLQDFYNKILSPAEQKIWDLFVFNHYDQSKLCSTFSLSRRSISWRIRRISNKVWFYGTQQLIDFYLENAGYTRKIKWKPYPKVFTMKQKKMYADKTKGKRVFVTVQTLETARMMKRSSRAASM